MGKQNGSALGFAMKDFKSDRAVVMAACQCEGAALQFAADELRGDADIVLAAVEQDGSAMQFIEGSAASVSGLSTVVEGSEEPQVIRTVPCPNARTSTVQGIIQACRC